MSLSRPAPREHVHSREIRCRGYRRADGLWDIEAVLEDTKTYSFANHDRGGVVSGEPIYRMHIRLSGDDTLVVRTAEAFTEAAPFTLCGDIAPAFAGLVGLSVGPGWRKAVLARMAGVRGCTHLTDLLIGPVTQTLMQTVAAARSSRQTARRGRSRRSSTPATHWRPPARSSLASGPSSTLAPPRSRTRSRSGPSAAGRGSPAWSCADVRLQDARAGMWNPGVDSDRAISSSVMPSSMPSNSGEDR